MIEHHLFDLTPQAPFLMYEHSHPATSEDQGARIRAGDLGTGIGPGALMAGEERGISAWVICCDCEQRRLRFCQDVWKEMNVWMWRWIQVLRKREPAIALPVTRVVLSSRQSGLDEARRLNGILASAGHLRR